MFTTTTTITTASGPTATQLAQLAAVREQADIHRANAAYAISTGDFMHNPIEPGRTLRIPWKAAAVEKLFRDEHAGKGGEKGGMTDARVEKVLAEYIKDKRDSMRTTGHIDKKLTKLERSVADLGLHDHFDTARKKDGKLGNGPLLASPSDEAPLSGKSDV